MRSTRFVIDCSKLQNNISEIKKCLRPSTYLMAIVKANAYGHGMLKIAQYSLKYGADWLGVAIPEEGAYLRENGIEAPILVLGAPNGTELEMCVKYNLHQTVFSANQIIELNEIAKNKGKTAYVHIKINSGMNRIGVSSPEELVQLLDTLKSCGHVNADGIFTHFATADSQDMSYIIEQTERFEELLSIAKAKGHEFEYVHACNTAGIMRDICPYCNMVRLGIGLYGYYPSEYMKKISNVNIKPVAEFITYISAVNNIAQGDAVSYGASFHADKPMRIATLPVGYADGYSRMLSNCGSVIINGKLAKITGVICMDQMMVDITDIPDADVGTQAVLIGEQGNVSIDADEIAEKCMTISYEVLTSVSARVEREYKE